MFIKGTMNSGAVITNEVPTAEWDDLTTANMIYMRYEIVDNDTAQYLERIDQSGATKLRQRTRDTWNNRVTAIYSPINL